MAKLTGIKDCFEKVDTGLAWSKLFISYFYFYYCYPAVELLIKMGKPIIIGKILKSCAHSGNRDALNANIEKLNKLLNPEATKGKQALNSTSRIPPRRVCGAGCRHLPAARLTTYWRQL